MLTGPVFAGLVASNLDPKCLICHQPSLCLLGAMRQILKRRQYLRERNFRGAVAAVSRDPGSRAFGCLQRNAASCLTPLRRCGKVAKRDLDLPGERVCGRSASSGLRMSGARSRISEGAACSKHQRIWVGRSRRRFAPASSPLRHLAQNRCRRGQPKHMAKTPRVGVRIVYRSPRGWPDWPAQPLMLTLMLHGMYMLA